MESDVITKRSPNCLSWEVGLVNRVTLAQSFGAGFRGEDGAEVLCTLCECRKHSALPENRELENTEKKDLEQ